ncbi:MAG: hypothetical protein ACR2LM_05425 [Pyrinomonadaceae bacterium]
MVSGKLEESLRHEIESYIEGRLSGVKQEIAELQSRLNEALTQLLDRQSEVQLDGAVAGSILEHLRAAHDEGIDLATTESSRAKASSDIAIVKAAVAEIGEQTTQAEILKTLVNRAVSFAPRVAFFAIKGEKAIGWRGRGFEGSVGDNAVQQISLPLSPDNLLGDVVQSLTTWSGGAHSHPGNHALFNRLGQETPQRIVGIPLKVRNRAVAVLYADSGGLDSEAINLEALETLAQVSGMAVELLAGQAPAQTPAPPAEQTSEAPAPAQATSSYAPEREYEAAEPAHIEPTAEEVAAPELAAEAVSEEARPSTEIALAEVVEADAEPLEATVEAEAAPVAEEPVSAPTGRRRYGADVELPVTVSGDEERKLHIDARRFARLLVSEIKLYNEQKVSEGRSENDLYARLREYIDRSRDMYDKRVKPEVAQSYDYFHHELVNTLAEGDAAKLGSAYPGATVSA